MNWPNYPGTGITLDGRTATSHIPSISGTRARNERPPAGPEKYTEVLGHGMSKQNFQFLQLQQKCIFSKMFRHMTDPHGALIMRRCKFIFRLDRTVRQRRHQETAEKYYDSKINLQISNT